MKVLFSHLKKFLPNDISIEKVSNILFQLGHENEFDKNTLDIEFTPNKGDCLSVFGLARDLNSMLDMNLDLDIYSDNIEELNFDFENDDYNFCPRISFLKIEIDKPSTNYKPYLESYFKDLKNSKNNFFADISNYLAYEIGQPTHCYEFKEVKDGIKLTTTNKVSSFKTLLGKTIQLSQGENIFVKNNEIVNLAGVMGGETTKCTKTSTTALVECAFFNPDMVIGKSVKYDLSSDAAYKFERGVDICGQNFALRRFIEIVKDHAEVKSASVKSYCFNEYEHKYLKKDYSKINNILGTSVKEEEINQVLKKLGFKIDNQIKIPSWRLDIESANDIAEEIARVIGYDNIVNGELKIINTKRKNSLNSKENLIRKYLINKGFNEVINDPFVEEKLPESIIVDNPLDSNREYLRVNIINSLIKNLDYNEKRQKESIKFFEISDVYTLTDQTNSKRCLSIIISGRQGLNFNNFNKKLDNKYLSDILSDFKMNDSIIKQVDRNSLNSKVKNKIYYIECNIDDINTSTIKDSYDYKEKQYFNFNKASPISEFPSSTRDISISIQNDSVLEEVIDATFNLELSHLKDLFIFDYYNNKDKNILKIGFRFVFQSSKKTLEENEIDNEIMKVFKTLKSYKDIEIPGLNL